MKSAEQAATRAMRRMISSCVGNRLDCPRSYINPHSTVLRGRSPSLHALPDRRADDLLAHERAPERKCLPFKPITTDLEHTRQIRPRPRLVPRGVDVNGRCLTVDLVGARQRQHGLKELGEFSVSSLVGRFRSLPTRSDKMRPSGVKVANPIGFSPYPLVTVLGWTASSLAETR